MRFALHLLLALAAAIATYFALVLTALLAAGAVSCTKNCSGVAEFLNATHPSPLLFGIGLSLVVAGWTLRQLRR